MPGKSLFASFYFLPGLAKKGKLQGLSLKSMSRVLSISCNSSAPECTFRNGLVVVRLPLPSRAEECEFSLKPVSHSVRDLTTFIKNEDGGVDRAVVYSSQGVRLSSSTPIEVLVQDAFKVAINDVTYVLTPPKIDMSRPVEDQLSNVKNLITQLYADLHGQEYREQREKLIKQRLEELKLELHPMEEMKTTIDERAAKSTNFLVWAGLGYMALQFGFLARLTWWEYSWDIMEPVTYFITYGTSMAAYAYFVLTRQEYLYPDARNRQYLLRFHRKASKAKFDVNAYNAKKDAILKLEEELKLLHAPPILLPPQAKEGGS